MEREGGGTGGVGALRRRRMRREDLLRLRMDGDGGRWEARVLVKIVRKWLRPGLY